jgi:hypothetical protein
MSTTVQQDTTSGVDHDTGDAVVDSIPSEVENTLEILEDFPEKEECSAILVMKCGDPQLAVRKKIHEDIYISFIPEEGYCVFQSKVERHFEKVPSNYVQEQRAIYFKPSNNAAQSKYIALTKENFDSLLRARWRVARNMRSELKYEVFCYFIDTSNKKEKKIKPRTPESVLTHTHGSSKSSSICGGSTRTSSTAGVGFPLGSSVFGHTNANYMDFSTGILDATSMQAIKRALQPPSKAFNRNNVGRTVDEDSMHDSEQPRKFRVLKSTRSNSTDIEHEPVFCALPFRINGVVVPLEVDILTLKKSLEILSSVGGNIGGEVSTASTEACDSNP